MSDLLTLQIEFGRCLQVLMAKILSEGYGYTMGEGHRTPEQAAINSLPLIDRKAIQATLESTYPVLGAAIGGSTSRGIKNSVHTKKLAQDLSLFKDGVFCEKAEDYLQFGVYWKTLHPAARYGGDFDDSDHFSFEYKGTR